MGKTSLAKTYAEFLNSPSKTPTPVLTQDNPDLLCTRVMQLYDGLSINKMNDLSVQVREQSCKHPAGKQTNHDKELTPSVKLVKLKPNLPVRMGMIQILKNKVTSCLTRAAPETTAFPEEIQLKIVDMGGHTAPVLESFHFHL